MPRGRIGVGWPCPGYRAAPCPVIGSFHLLKVGPWGKRHQGMKPRRDMGGTRWATGTAEVLDAGSSQRGHPTAPPPPDPITSPGAAGLSPGRRWLRPGWQGHRAAPCHRARRLLQPRGLCRQQQMPATHHKWLGESTESPPRGSIPQAGGLRGWQLPFLESGECPGTEAAPSFTSAQGDSFGDRVALACCTLGGSFPLKQTAFFFFFF